MSAPFTARYRGRCPACDGPITPGEQLVYDEDDQVVHADPNSCLPLPAQPEATPCPSCWLTSCDCEATG